MIFLNTNGQFIPGIEPVIYDKDKNIINTLDYFRTYGQIETTFRETATNIPYKPDKSHHFVTAINLQGDTLWNVDLTIFTDKNTRLKQLHWNMEISMESK